MNKITNLFKSLLVVAMLGIGSNAWGEDIYTILYGTAIYTGETITGVSPQTDFTDSDGTVASNYSHDDANGNTAAMPVTGSVLASTKSFTKSFPTAATKGIVHFEANYTTTTNGQETFKVVDSKGVEIFGTTDAGYSNSNATKNWGFCNGVALGTGWFRQARNAHNRIVLDINLSTKMVSYTVLVSSGNATYTTLTGTYALPDNVEDVAGLTATKQTYYAYMDYVSFYNVYDNAATEAPYTINYIYNEETIKTTTGSIAVGSTIYAESPIIVAGVRYYAVDNATMSKEIEAGENELNVAIRLANTYNYEVKAVDGSDNELAIISSDSYTEGGAEIAVAYPRYILSGTTLYSSGTGAIAYKTTLTPDADNYVKKITYNSGTVSNVVYYTEGEDVAGASQGTNADRASVGKMGYTANSTTYLDVTTLDPGIYQLYVRGQNANNAARAFSFKVGDTEVYSGSITNGTNKDSNSGNFLVTSASTLSFACEGSSASGIDYFYIVKTGECYESMSIVGDFSANEWDATGGIAMTRNPENPHVWTAVVKDFVVTSSKYNYEYKATANGTWGVYELGEDDNSSNNQTYNFDYDGAREGKYTLTFTVNTSTNRVSLAIEKQHTYTVVGCYNNDETPSFFGTAWAPTLEDNDMTDNGDGTYTKTFNNVTLEIGTIWYKVVEDHAWTNSWGFDPSKNGGNADYYVGTAGTYHITFTFNPNADGYKVSCSLIPATVSKTITSAGWATYCSPYALDFTNAIANLDAAYIVTGGADGVLEMTEVTGIVPANTGLLLKGEGDVAIPVASSDANVDVSANKLEGVTENTVIAAEAGYVLMASPSLGFYKNSNAFTVGANTAYLPADFDVTSARFFLLDGGKTTSISEQFLDEPSGKAERTVNSEKLVYDLQGRRVNSSLKPGLYIMSGKKVVIK